MEQTAFTYEAGDRALLVHLPKELDHHNCSILKCETDLLLEENYITRIIFDFGKTEFMDSSGIGVILSRYKQMKLSGGQVAVFGAGPRIMRILNMGGITRLVSFYESKDAAMRG